MERWTTAVILILVLTAANFIFQVFANQEWARAAERSYFQAVAVLIAAWWRIGAA